MCKEISVIQVNRVVDKKRIIGKTEYRVAQEDSFLNGFCAYRKSSNAYVGAN
jgi:hypothetical protein